MIIKKAGPPFGRPAQLYMVTYITPQTFRQESIFVRFVWFIIIMLRKNRIRDLFLPNILPLFSTTEFVNWLSTQTSQAMKPLLLLLCMMILTNVVSAQNRFDILITEIMADPSPQVGLPSNEWIELKNNSAAPVNLQGWRIADANGQSGVLPDFVLDPGDYVVVCTGSALAAMSAFGNAVSVTSFPSLDNDGEILFVKDASGKTIHAVEYASNWYQNELKKEGGWTLEMIDTGNPCSGSSNWNASIANNGGTPSASNSVSATNPDRTAPELQRAYARDPSLIVLVFNESVDSLSATVLSGYSVDGGITITGAKALPPLFREVELTSTSPLSSGTIYTFVATSINDCSGNTVGNRNTAKVGLPSVAIPGDAVINEILFDPRPNAFDYVEFYNRSDRILDASQLYIANRNSSQAISSITPVSISRGYIFPGDYFVVTIDPASLALNYLVSRPEAVFSISSMPSFPDDGGTVLLLNHQGDILDELSYSDKWHFPLIDEAEGVSLERLDIDATTQDAANWHSAASTAGYGTPGYKNSQTRNQQAISATIEVLPKVFSPDNDGFDDIASIHYKMAAPGYVANVTIFDAAGRPVRNLVRNGMAGNSGYWNWDGLDDKGLKLPVGTYILYTEIFNLEGRKQKFKNAVVLARKF